MTRQRLEELGEVSGFGEVNLVPAYPFDRFSYGDVVLDLEKVLDRSGKEDDLLLLGEVPESRREEEGSEVGRLGRMVEEGGKTEEEPHGARDDLSLLPARLEQSHRLERMDQILLPQ